MLKKQFIEFFYIFGENNLVFDNSRLDLYKEKILEILKKVVSDKIEYLSLFDEIDKHKNDSKKGNLFHPIIEEKLKKQFANYYDTHFTETIYNWKSNFYNFFTSKYILETKNGSAFLNDVKHIQKKLFDIVIDEKLIDFLYIAVDTKTEIVFLCKEQNNYQSNLNKAYTDLKNEKKSLAIDYNFMIFEQFCKMLIKDTDFQIFFIDERYYERVVFFT